MNAVQPEAVQRVPRVRALCAVVHMSCVWASVLAVGIALPASGLEPFVTPTVDWPSGAKLGS